MLELGHQLGLALEPPPSLIVLGDLGLDQFEGALPVKLEVVNPPDLAHPSLADLLDEPVLVEDLLPLRDHRGGGVTMRPSRSSTSRCRESLAGLRQAGSLAVMCATA